VDLGHLGDEFFDSVDYTGLTIDHNRENVPKLNKKMHDILWYIVLTTLWSIKNQDITLSMITLSNLTKLSPIM